MVDYEWQKTGVAHSNNLPPPPTQHLTPMISRSKGRQCKHCLQEFEKSDDLKAHQQTCVKNILTQQVFTAATGMLSGPAFFSCRLFFEKRVQVMA